MSLEEGPFVFRVNENGSGPNLLIQVCMERGWREYIESNPFKDGWNLWWKTSAFSISQHRHLKAWQFTNHIPKGASICRKDNLARNLKCMRKVYGTIYDISPHGYNLPLEYTKLVADCSRRDDDEDESQKVWICKPVGQSQGKGIFLFKSLSDLCYDSNAVVQRYIKNPLLIGGYKFDLRLYVCVPSYHPLTIYLYREGLVRFSTDKFSMSDLNNPFCHLTNSSLNKLGPGYAEQKDRIGAGCKWSFRQLRQYFQQAGIRDWLLWQKISALVTLTVLSQCTSVPQTINCFEFYGFDVLIDENLKPWLLEVNLSPALGKDCDVDPVVKKPLLHDLFDLLGLPVCYTGLSLFTIFSPPENKFSHLEKYSSRTKSITSSAIIVAAAASKWRRKRKNYLLGTLQKSGVDYDKKKSAKEHPKSALPLHNLVNMITLEPQKDKEDGKLQEKKTQLNSIISYRQDRKLIKNGKYREKCKIEKNFAIGADAMTRNKTKYCCHTSLKTVTCADNSKVLMKIENVIGENHSHNSNSKVGKSKKNGTTEEGKNGKCRMLESKSFSVLEKPKSNVMKQSETMKAIMFPIDKSTTTSKGFKGRIKPYSPMLWGNGRDWRNPIHREGDWERIYPINSFPTKYNPTFEEDIQGNKFSVGDKEIRVVVHHITNFIKISKQIYYKETNATEEELNSQLINHLGMTGDVWLPSK